MFPFVYCNNGYVVNGTIDTSKVTYKDVVVTYSYAGVKSVTYTYNVVPRKVTSLEVISDKTTYVQGQPLEIKVNATWNDGKVEKNVRYVTNANTNTVGDNQTAVITYKDATATYNYNVIARKVTKLDVISNKTTYIQGQPLEIKVNATWNDGKVEKNVDFTTTANTDTVGDDQKATITYGGASTTFKYNVIARKVTSLKINSTKNTYYKGEAFEITVDAKWNDGKEEKNVNYSTTANTNTIGNNQNAVISYKGATANYSFNVISRITLRVVSTDNDYIKGEPINNITVYAKDANGRETKVTGYTINGNTNTVGNNQTATISYQGATVTYTYNVKYELHLVKHGNLLYLEFAENVNVKAIAYYDKKGSKSVIYETGYNNKDGNKYYLTINQYNEMHSMKGQHDKQRLVVTDNNNAEYTYTKVVVTNK